MPMTWSDIWLQSRGFEGVEGCTVRHCYESLSGFMEANLGSAKCGIEMQMPQSVYNRNIVSGSLVALMLPCLPFICLSDHTLESVHRQKDVFVPITTYRLSTCFGQYINFKAGPLSLGIRSSY